MADDSTGIHRVRVFPYIQYSITSISKAYLPSLPSDSTSPNQALSTLYIVYNSQTKQVIKSNRLSFFQGTNIISLRSVSLQIFSDSLYTASKPIQWQSCVHKPNCISLFTTGKKNVISRRKVGPYGKKLWPRAWKCCPRCAASASHPANNIYLLFLSQASERARFLNPRIWLANHALVTGPAFYKTTHGPDFFSRSTLYACT